MKEKVVYLYYYEEENVFADEFGRVVYDIFDLITPQDLYLFKRDKGFNLFKSKVQNVLCELVLIPDETCGAQEIPKINFGDDVERIGRYEKSKSSGCFV